MSLPKELTRTGRSWLEQSAPCSNVVMTSRARLARNLMNHPFAPHAGDEVLADICAEIDAAFRRGTLLKDFIRVDLGEATQTERIYLKELRLISRELERGGEYRLVFVRPDLKASIMVNEEDHLRIQCIEPGLQINRVQERLNELEEELAGLLNFAYHQELGYLTACPTNVGTGLRVSTMMHLPGLALRRDVQNALKPLPSYGLTMRGFYGENSENLGDYFQISNEVTLGKTVWEIEENLAEMVSQIMDREVEARSLLRRDGGMTIQDAMWRSYGTLTHSRKMDSSEAMKLLSRIRLGIDEGLVNGLTHEKLNKLILDIQPGHLVFRHGAPDESAQRDVARAAMLRKFFANHGGSPSAN